MEELTKQFKGTLTEFMKDKRVLRAPDISEGAAQVDLFLKKESEALLRAAVKVCIVNCTDVCGPAENLRKKGTTLAGTGANRVLHAGDFT